MHTAAMKIETDSAVAMIFGAAVSAVLAIIGAILKRIFGRKKDDADAEATAVGTMMVVVGKLETERDALAKRVVECERDNRHLQRRNMLLERIMSQHNIDIPPNNVGERHDDA